MTTVHHPELASIQLQEVLGALADDARLEIIHQLRDGQELSCHQIITGVGKSTLSHHLRVLRMAGITQTTVVGRERFVALRPQLDERFPGLVRNVLDQRVGAPWLAAAG